MTTQQQVTSKTGLSSLSIFMDIIDMNGGGEDEPANKITYKEWVELTGNELDDFARYTDSEMLHINAWNRLWAKTKTSDDKDEEDSEDDEMYCDTCSQHIVEGSDDHDEAQYHEGDVEDIWLCRDCISQEHLLGENPGDDYHVCDRIIVGDCLDPVWHHDNVLKRNEEDLLLCPKCFDAYDICYIRRGKGREKKDEPICCVGCSIDGIFPENRDGDTMCPSCQEDDDDVFCVSCDEIVCGFHEEPPHKNKNDEALHDL